MPNVELVWAMKQHIKISCSTKVAADIMNWAFQTLFYMFKVNKSEFNVMVAITSHSVEAFKKWPKHTQNKNNMVS